MTKTLFSLHESDHTPGGTPFSHSGGQVASQQPTPISKGIKTLRAIANMAYAFSSRYKRRQWVACSRCAKRRITPRVLFLISSLLFAKSSPFSGKSRLVFPPSSRASFFPPGLPNEMGHFPTLSHSFLPPAQALFPFDHHLPTRALDFPRPFHLLHKTKQQQLIRR